MPRKTLNSELKQLQFRQQQLQQQLQQLQDSRRAEQLKHALGVKWCEAIDYIAESIYALHFPGEPLEPTAAGNLQQQLRELTSSSGEWPTLEELLQPDASTICPPTDPVLPLCRRVVSPAVQQPLQANDITAEGVCLVLRETYSSLAIKLQHLQAAVAPEDRQSVLSEMAGLWDRTLQATAAIYVKGGREHFVEQAYCFNLETLQLEPEAATRHHEATAAAMVPALGLSKQQEELIAVGLRIYCDMINSSASKVHAEQQQLQEQPAPMEDMCSPSGSEHQQQLQEQASLQEQLGMGLSSFSSNGSRASSSTGASSPVDQLWGEKHQLEQQQVQSSRLMAVMHKEHWARAIASLLVYGGLSYEQLSRAAVLSWPFPLRVTLLGLAIMRQWESRSPQQQQSQGSK